jgi:radical SAM superfamily enzyme YgiQ (UPF0313 family)
MRILFVSGNREQLPDAVIPLGLLYVMANTPESHEAHLLDLCFVEDPERRLTDEIAAFHPDLVALGMRNIQNADYSGISHSLDYYKGLIAAVRGATDVPVVLGGAGFSVMPRNLMLHLRPDYGISGEGEQAFPALLDALVSGERRELAAVGNLHWFENGELQSSARPQGFLDMNHLVVPNRAVLDDRYYDVYGIDSVQTKRGCPLRCDYCTYPIIEGRVGRARDPVRVVDELIGLRDGHPDVNHVFIVDSVFNLPRTHAKQVCREMIARDFSIPWTCYANPLGFDEELAELLAASGCAGMEIGSDAGNDKVLESLRKGFSVDHIRRIHDLAKAAGVPDCHTFILGTPGENVDDVRRTLDFIVELDPFSVILMIWTDDAEALDLALMRQREGLRDGIRALLDEAKGDFPWWSIPALGVNYDAELFANLRGAGLHGPLWQHLRSSSTAVTPYRRRRQPPAVERLAFPRNAT